MASVSRPRIVTKDHLDLAVFPEHVQVALGEATPNSYTASAAAHRPQKPRPSTTLTYHSQPADLHTNRGVHQTRVASALQQPES
jgi:hypothetical protein